MYVNISSMYIIICTCTWMFPKIMVPPNHPILIGFSIIFTIHFGGKSPIFGNIRIVRLEFTLAEPWVCTSQRPFSTGFHWGLVAELLVADFGIKKSGRKVVLFEICVLICTLFVAFLLYIYKAYIYIYTYIYIWLYVWLYMFILVHL